MVFRKANTADIPKLCILRRLQWTEEGQTLSPKSEFGMDEFFYRMMNQGHLVQYLAEEGRQVAATGAVCFYDFPPSFQNPSGTVAYITNMYTHPPFRRKGLALQLLELLVKEIRGRGVNRVLLAASAQGEPVYQHFGFQQDSTWYSLWLEDRRTIESSGTTDGSGTDHGEYRL